jgi:hypothetical protein
MIRAIALGELEFSSAWKAVVKQVSVSICIAPRRRGCESPVAAFLWKGNPYLGLGARRRDDSQSWTNGGKSPAR